MRLRKITLLITTMCLLSACGSTDPTSTNNVVVETETQETETTTEIAEPTTEMNSETKDTSTTERSGKLHIYVDDEGYIVYSKELGALAKETLATMEISEDYMKSLINRYYKSTLDKDNTVIYNNILNSLAGHILAEIENIIPVKELNQTMYATGSVNTRSGDSTDYEKIGSLSLNQEVLVTGQSERTGWYRISVNGQEMYVSNNYLSTEKTVVQSNNNGGSGDSSNNGSSSEDDGSSANWNPDPSIWGDVDTTPIGGGGRVETGATIGTP